MFLTIFREEKCETNFTFLFSSVSSLSRSSVTTTLSCPPLSIAATTVSSSLASSSNSNNKQWGNGAPTVAQPAPIPAHSASSIPNQHSQTSTQLSPAPPRPTPPLHSNFVTPTSAPMFTAPLPPAISRASPMTSATSSVVPPQQPNPNPFSAENLFQSSKYQASELKFLQ